MGLSAAAAAASRMIRHGAGRFCRLPSGDLRGSGSDIDYQLLLLAVTARWRRVGARHRIGSKPPSLAESGPAGSRKT